MEIPQIDTQLLTRGPFPVRVIRIKSPTLFWVQPRNSLKDFQEFQEDLNREMRRHHKSLTYFSQQLKIGEIVAIKEGRRWQRGEVTRLNALKATIELKDWGRSTTCSVQDIYHLRDEFRTLPWRAIPCGLAHVEPAISTRVWPQRATDVFKALAENQDGWIRIRASLNGRAAFVDLETINEGGWAYNNVQRQMESLGYLRHSRRLAVNVLPAIYA